MHHDAVFREPPHTGGENCVRAIQCIQRVPLRKMSPSYWNWPITPNKTVGQRKCGGAALMASLRAHRRTTRVTLATICQCADDEATVPKRPAAARLGKRTATTHLTKPGVWAQNTLSGQRLFLSGAPTRDSMCLFLQRHRSMPATTTPG